MKCHKPDTDMKFSVTLRADEEECIEFVEPSAFKSGPDTIQCFLPVSDGQKLTLRVEIEGTMHQCCVDILADGNFVAQRRFQNKGARHRNYHFTFQTFKRSIDHEGDPTHILTLPKIVDGDILTKPLRSPFATHSTSDFGVGSLAVLIYSNQRESEPRTTEPSYADQTDFKQRIGGPDGGIKPTHELMFTTTKDDIRRDAQTLFLRNAKGDRPGSKPFATFMVYYRSHEAIRQAGCILDPIDDHKLSPMHNQLAALKTAEKTDAKISSKQQQSGRSTSLGSSTLAAPPNQPKKKLMNQPFPGPRKSSTIGISTLDVNANNTASPPISAVGSSIPPPAPAQPKRKLMNQPFPPRREASTMRPFMLSMGANDAPPLPNLAMGLREAALLPTAPRALQKNRGPGQSTRRPVSIESDRESDDNDMPPKPVTFLGSRKSAPSIAPPLAPPKKRGPSQSVHRPLFIESDSESDNDGVPPPPEADSRADKPPRAPVVPAMASEGGRGYLPGASQDGAAGKRKRSSDAAAPDAGVELGGQWLDLEAKAARIAEGKKRTMGK